METVFLCRCGMLSSEHGEDRTHEATAARGYDETVGASAMRRAYLNTRSRAEATVAEEDAR